MDTAIMAKQLEVPVAAFGGGLDYLLPHASPHFQKLTKKICYGSPYSWN